MIKKDIATKWVAALRSGDYTQTTQAMKAEAGGMCCLGVLSDLYAKEHPEAGWKNDSPNVRGAIPFHTDLSSTSKMSKDVATAMPTDAVEEWIGATYKDDSMTFFQSLAVANDSGDSFAEIADKIEQHVNEKVEANAE
jgi:hypothetical protein